MKLPLPRRTCRRPANEESHQQYFLAYSTISHFPLPFLVKRGVDLPERSPGKLDLTSFAVIHDDGAPMGSGVNLGESSHLVIPQSFPGGCRSIMQFFVILHKTTFAFPFCVDLSSSPIFFGATLLIPADESTHGRRLPSRSGLSTRDPSALATHNRQCHRHQQLLPRDTRSRVGDGRMLKINDLGGLRCVPLPLAWKTSCCMREARVV